LLECRNQEKRKVQDEQDGYADRKEQGAGAREDHFGVENRLDQQGGTLFKQCGPRERQHSLRGLRNAGKGHRRRGGDVTHIILVRHHRGRRSRRGKAGPSGINFIVGSVDAVRWRGESQKNQGVHRIDIYKQPTVKGSNLLSFSPISKKRSAKRVSGEAWHDDALEIRY
jgi:hypothetical protein